MKKTERIPDLVLDRETGYFTDGGTDVIAFEDIYPAGHQGGVSIVMHGERIAANGDVRLEPTPGQWQPLPRQTDRRVDEKAQRIVTHLVYPDAENHLKGFNPMIYPDLAFGYTVTVKAEGRAVLITADTDGPLPPEWEGRIFFSLELFPGLLFGRPWIMDEGQGIFPRHPTGPVEARPPIYSGGIYPGTEVPEGYIDRLTEKGSAYSPMRGGEETAAPYARGRCFTLCPDEPRLCLTVETLGEDLRLYDGRISHNNGWFVLSAPLSSEGPHALRWVLTPAYAGEAHADPRIQISQAGYLPGQRKVAVIELDKEDREDKTVTLFRIQRGGRTPVLREKAEEWGRFLRYRYVRLDFTSVTAPGLYRVECGGVLSEAFRIAPDVFDRGVWQPVLEYFLPVQMCHMRVQEKYRVWHGRCHMDDARMAPVGWNHFDGYRQGGSTLTRFKGGEAVPGLDRGGWHDAGDFDLRIESQSGEAYQLALTWEAFHPEWDSTTVDQVH